MALCESQLDSAMPQIKQEESTSSEQLEAEVRIENSEGECSSTDKILKSEQNGTIYRLNEGPSLPLSVDYRSPVSHFIPPAVEIFASRNNSRSRSEIADLNPDQPSPATTTDPSTADSSECPTPVKRKRGRPRVDKTSPEYLAKSAARKQAREMAAMMNNSSESGEKRKRGRPRIDKTSPEYLARKKAKELEALEKKAKRQNKRRGTGDSAASSSAGDTPRVKRKYTKRNSGGPGPGRPRKTEAGTPGADRVKGKRGRPRKADLIAAGLLDPNAPRRQQPGKIRVRNNLMPSETITLDSDDEPNLGSPSQASDSLSLDENLRALRHLHEKYANLERDDALNAQLLAGNCRRGDDVIALSEEERSVKGLDTRVEKLEDSSNSDSDSSTSGSGSSSSSSSSSSGSGSSSSSDSDSDSSGDEKPPAEPKPPVANNVDINRTTSGGAWSERTHSDSESDISESERDRNYGGGGESGSLSESDNESPDKSYQCHVCKKWYSTIVTLKIHRRSHLARAGNNSRSRPRHSDRYECDCCNETFSRREKLWEHKAAAHRGQMTVRCEVCRKCFEDDAVLAAHTLTHTADERAGRCEDCGLTFPRHEQLRRHRTAAHGARAMSHTCAQCGKGFTHAHSLTRHLHNHARQLYRCVVCKASFARADQLAQHLNSHLANYKRLKP